MFKTVLLRSAEKIRVLGTAYAAAKLKRADVVCVWGWGVPKGVYV